MSFSLKCVAAVLVSILSALYLSALFFSIMDEDSHKTAIVEEENKSTGTEEQSPASAKYAVGDTGFHFTESGEFLDENGSKFQFAVTDDHAHNQSRYEKIGDAVTEYIYSVMESKYGLNRIHIPIGVEKSEASSFVFVSEKFKDSGNKKLVLINGSGAVKAGQWARSIIINDNLYPGSMLPYIEWAAQNDFDVLALNTNECGSNMNGSQTPFEHAQTVWDDFIGAVQNKIVFIVAHSFGGVVVQSLSKDNSNFGEIVFKVAFTDSVHMGKISGDSVPCINWVTSSKPVDTHLGARFGCEMRSAGSTNHPWTSHYAMDYIFDWFTGNDNVKHIKDAHDDDKMEDSGN